MSFACTKSVVEENDTVMVYLDPKCIYPVQVTPTILAKNGERVEHIFQTKYGALKVKDLIGRQFGYKVKRLVKISSSII